MILNLADPAISKAYEAIVRDEAIDWLILGYSKARDALCLIGSGSGGLDVLRSQLREHSNDVNFSLVKANGLNYLVLVCFIPPSITRAIVHCRAIEDIFPARRAVVNISQDIELTPDLLAHALRKTPHRNLAPETRLPAEAQRPMSPPRSSEEGRSYNPPPRIASLGNSSIQERELPLNLPEPLDSEREREVAIQRVNSAEPPGMNSAVAPKRRATNARKGKPQLTVSVPPRTEQRSHNTTYGGVGRAGYESDDVEEEDDHNEEDECERTGDAQDEEYNFAVRLNPGPSFRGPTPPPGPSILRHPSPIPMKIDLGSSITGLIGSSTHIRFTGPPKDHPHPDHHPLKPSDLVVIESSRTKSPPAGLTSTTENKITTSAISGTPASSSALFEQTGDAPSRTLKNSLSPQDHIQASPAGIRRTSPDQLKLEPAVVASTMLLPSVTCLSASQPGPSVPDTLNDPQPPENLQSANPQTGQMLPLRPSVLSPQRSLPQLPPVSAVPSTSSTLSKAPSSFSAHSRNNSASANSGQTHVPSRTLCAFGRRPSVSNSQPGGSTSVPSGSALRLQLDHISPSALIERSSTVNTTATSSSTSASLRSFVVQTQGMTEAQAQAARSRAKWAAEEQGLTVPQTTPTPPRPRSPPLTPPISPPRLLNADEAGRVRRDGVEKMRREAERRREEDERRRLAEQRRLAEVEQQQRLDREREMRERQEHAEKEKKRKAMELQKQAMEAELGKRRAEEKIRVRGKFDEVRGTDEVFLTGHVNIQAQNTMTWRRRFYELTANGCLRLYKSSDAPDCIKPLDIIDIQGAQSIDRGVDELELIPYAFRVQLAGANDGWSFYADSQHDMDMLTDDMASVAVQKSVSRPSSRSSYRAPSPADSPEPNGRNGSHSKRASLIPRPTTPQRSPLSPVTSPSLIPAPLSAGPTTPTNRPHKARRSSSFDKLAAISSAGGIESMIPLPVRVTTPSRQTGSPTMNGNYLSPNGLDADIPEGVPIEFGATSPSLNGRRSSSPTRTLSRIPVSSVGHARTLADDGHRQRAPSPTTPSGDTSLLADASFRSSINSSTLLSPLPAPSTNSTSPTSPSPGYRRSLVGGGTTKVLADLQAHTIQVKSVLENTKSQLRASQRTIAQLTRQTEDLKDGRERMRLENESLNNVVTRKERLLQETAERARRAESEVQTLKSQLKEETSASKKAAKDMQTTLSQAKAVAQRSEREYVQLRETLTSMREGWRKEVEMLKEQMRGSQSEAQEAVSRQKILLNLLEEQRAERDNMNKLHAEYQALQDEFVKQFKADLANALETVEKSTRDCDTAGRTAKDVADELARLQRLIKAGP